MAKSKNLKKTLRLVANDNCQHCEGTGIRATNTYHAALRKLEVEFEICPCVRVKPLGLMLPRLTPDVTVAKEPVED